MVPKFLNLKLEKDGRQIITVRRGCRNNEWVDSCEPSGLFSSWPIRSQYLPTYQKPPIWKHDQDINGYQTVDCHNQYPITDQDLEQGNAVNAGNLQATMDYLLDGHPQGAVTSCQSCSGTGYIDPEVSHDRKNTIFYLISEKDRLVVDRKY